MCLGIPGKIVEIHRDRGLLMGTVDFGGIRRDVCLAYLGDDAQVGDFALVHVGFALTKIDEEEARRTFEVLKEMSELDELDWMREVAERGLEETRGAAMAPTEPPPAALEETAPVEA